MRRLKHGLVPGLLVIGFTAGFAVYAATPGSSGLVDAYIQALDHNPNYQAAVATYQMQAEAKPLALSKLLPQIAVSGNIAEANQSVSGQFFVNTPNGSPGFSVNHADEFHQFGYRIGLSEALFHRDLYLRLDQADLKVARAALQLDQAQTSLQLEIAHAYFALLSAGDQLKLAQAKRDALKQIEQQSKSRHDAGLVSDADYKQAQAGADQSAASLIVARNQVQLARATLDLLTGTQITQVKPLADHLVLPPPDPNDADTWVTRARTQNLGVQVSRLTARIAKLAIKTQEARRWPRLDLYAYRDYNYANGGISRGIGANNNHALDERAMLQVTVPIFSGGAVSAAIRTASAGFAHAQALESASEAKATTAAQIAFLNLESGQSRIQALKLSIDSAQAAEDAARVGYDVGTRTYADLLSSIQALYQAESSYAQARYTYIENLLKLKAAAGALSADDLQRINRWLQ